MRVLVCGGRTFSNLPLLDRELDVYHRMYGFTALIHGGAGGADQAAHFWAGFNRVPIHVYHARWDTEGKAAGPLRNQRMLDEGKPDFVVAFPGGRGTADMVRRAKAAGVKVIEVT